MRPIPIPRAPEAPIDGPWRVGVVIPARDEEDTVVSCVSSVVTAIETAGSLIAASVVVLVADSCRDRTVERVLDAHSRVRLVQCDTGIVGTARAVGSTVAMAMLGGPPEQTWLANTDADSVVDATWLRRQLASAGRGVECVAGVVDLLHPDPTMWAKFRHRYSAAIRDRDHDHVHGANLGVRGDALLRVGNWPAVANGEDRQLLHRIRAGGAAVDADPGLVVRTSPRTTGRAPGGFARDLRDLDTAVSA